MTKYGEKLVEEVARVLFETRTNGNAALEWHHAATPKTRYRKQAKSAIKALCAAGAERFPMLSQITREIE